MNTSPQEVYTDVEPVKHWQIENDIVQVDILIHEKCAIGKGFYQITFKGEPYRVYGNRFRYHILSDENILTPINPLQVKEIKIIWNNKD